MVRVTSVPSALTFPDMISGQNYDTRYSYGNGTGTASAMVANLLYASPLYLQKTTSFDRIGINVTTNAAAGKIIRLLVYASLPNGLPGALVLDAGSVAADAIAVVSATISLTLTPGLWYLGSVSDSTPSVLGMAATQTNLYGANSMSSSNYRGSPSQSGVNPLAVPNPFGTPSGYITNTTQLVGLRVA